MTKKLQIFTTGRESDIGLLVESAQSFGVPIAVYDAQWTTYVDVKLRRGLEFARSLDAENLMWLDGNDSLVLAPPDEILSRHKALGGGLILATESNCWPDADLARLYPTVPAGVPRFLNAGGFIGPKEIVLETMAKVLEGARDGDDQRAWTKWFTFQRGGVLDYGRRIFASVADGEGALQSGACTLHWNGRTPGREEYWAKVQKAQRALEVEG